MYKNVHSHRSVTSYAKPGL